MMRSFTIIAMLCLAVVGVTVRSHVTGTILGSIVRITTDTVEAFIPIHRLLVEITANSAYLYEPEKRAIADMTMLLEPINDELATKIRAVKHGSYTTVSIYRQDSKVLGDCLDLVNVLVQHHEKVFTMLLTGANVPNINEAAVHARNIHIRRMAIYAGVLLECVTTEFRKYLHHRLKGVFLPCWPGATLVSSICKGARSELLHNVIPYTDDDLQELVERYYELASHLHNLVDEGIEEYIELVEPDIDTFLLHKVRDVTINLSAGLLSMGGAELTPRIS